MMTIVVLIVGAAFAIILCAIETQKRLEDRVGFAPQPSIADDEFCETLSDVPEDVALKVRRVLADSVGWDKEEIHPNTRLIEFELW